MLSMFTYNLHLTSDYKEYIGKIRPDITYLFYLFTNNKEILSNNKWNEFLVNYQQEETTKDTKSIDIRKFYNYFITYENQLLNVNIANKQFEENMHPLSHYYINTSNKTCYITSNKYDEVIKRGARIVEITLIDGDTEPEVECKNTKSVSFENVLDNILSTHISLPIILDIKNTCKKQQAKVNSIISSKNTNSVKIFVILESTDRLNTYNKSIIIRSEVTNDNIDYTNLVGITIIPYELYDRAVNYDEGVKYTVTLEKTDSLEDDKLIMKTNQSIFKVESFDDASFNPLPFWNRGVHSVPSNFKINDVYSQINSAMFIDHNICGYVLKPNFLIGNNCDTEYCILILHIVCGHFQSLTDMTNIKLMVEIYNRKLDGLVESYLIEPVYNEKYKICLFDSSTFIFFIKCPQLSFLRFNLVETDATNIKQLNNKAYKNIAYFTIKVKNMLVGYRMVDLIPYDMNYYSTESKINSLIVTTKFTT